MLHVTQSLLQLFLFFEFMKLSGESKNICALHVEFCQVHIGPQ